MKPGDSVVIYGAGPEGLMAAHSAMIKGACTHRRKKERSRSVNRTDMV
jgi:predicted flavoprotein YhiN